MNSDKIEYIASVKRWGKNNLDKILDYMVSEGTGLTRPQALAYFEKLIELTHIPELKETKFIS